MPPSAKQCYQALDAVFTYLEELRTRPLGVQGYTHSAARPPAHFGAWWSAKRRRWIREKVVLCLVDYRVGFDHEQMTQLLAELRQAIRDAYTQFTGKTQEEFWVVAHHIVR